MENITKEQLEKIYLENTNSKAAEMLGVSKVTLIDMIEKAGIKKKGKGPAPKYVVIS